MMSIEEAGEEILAGPYADCPACNGQIGWVLEGTYITTCSTCFGNGKTVRKRYFNACLILGLPCPSIIGS